MIRPVLEIPALEPIPAEEVGSIAVVKPDHIGDLILHTPVFPALRRRFPKARITAVVGTWAAEALRNNPHVDEIVAFTPEWLDRDRVRFDLAKHRRNQEALARLAAKPFDLVINLRDEGEAVSYLNLSVNALLTGRWFLSYVKDHAELAMVSHPVAYRYERMHVLDRAKALLRAIGVEVDGLPALYPSAEDTAQAEALLGGKRYWVALAPGAGWPGKRWPSENFLALAAALQERGIPFLALGGKAEAGVAEEMEKRFGALNLCGKTTLLSAAAVLGKVAVVVNSDSAAAHMGAAMGARAINIMQPTARVEFVPLGRKEADVVSYDDCINSCRLWFFGRDPKEAILPCECVEGIGVERVRRAVFQALIDAHDAGELEG